MITSEVLAQFLQQALADKAAEPAFFRALLDAPVYAHVPSNDRHGRLRLIQCTTPEGLTVLPFFSDEAQARVAAGSAVVVVVMTGRELLGLTRGATLMLNPNETNCILYPEEISALLDHGQVAIIERIETGGQQLRFEAARATPAELIERLVTLFASLGSIQSAYMGEIGTADETEDLRLLIVAAVRLSEVEHVARATTAEIQVHCSDLPMVVDFTAYEPGSPPDWLKKARMQPFYVLAVDPGGVH